KLLAALLVDVRRAVDGELLNPGRQRDRPTHLCAGALRRRHDLARRRIEDAMVERFEPDPDVLAVHFLSLTPARSCRSRNPGQLAPLSQFPGSPLSRERTEFFALLDDARNNARANSAAALADGETELLF